MSESLDPRRVPFEEAKRWPRQALAVLCRRSGLFAAWTLVLLAVMSICSIAPLGPWCLPVEQFTQLGSRASSY